MIITVSKCVNCGVKHMWDFDAPRLKELRTIKKLTGLKGEAFADALADQDPDALAALLFILHERDKIKIPFDDVDLDLTTIDMAESDEEKQAREKMEREQKGKGQRRRSGPTPKAD